MTMQDIGELIDGAIMVAMFDANDQNIDSSNKTKMVKQQNRRNSWSRRCATDVERQSH